MFKAAVDAAQAEKVIPKHLPDPPTGRTVVIGAGKASAAVSYTHLTLPTIYSV